MTNEERAAKQAEVLGANAEFYRAFRDADFPAMERVWSLGSEVVCVHPGGAPLVGRRAVMESFRSILDTAGGFRVNCRESRVFLLGEASAFVTCLEANGERPAHLAATNVFVCEGGGWVMVQHQAGPLSRPVAASADLGIN